MSFLKDKIKMLTLQLLQANIITMETIAIQLVLTIMMTEIRNRNHKQLFEFNYTIIRVLLS